MLCECNVSVLRGMFLNTLLRVSACVCVCVCVCVYVPTLRIVQNRPVRPSSSLNIATPSITEIRCDVFSIASNCAVLRVFESVCGVIWAFVGNCGSWETFIYRILVSKDAFLLISKIPELKHKEIFYIPLYILTKVHVSCVSSGMFYTNVEYHCSTRPRLDRP